MSCFNLHRFIPDSMDSPWDDDPKSTNAVSGREYINLDTEFTNAGYREGITAGKESALQEGFDQGFAIAGVPIGRELGLMRGIVSAILAFLNDNGTSVSTETDHHRHQLITETQEIGSRLSRIRFSDVIPPDLEAEEHARLHQEEVGVGLDMDRDGSRTTEVEMLEDMIEQMNTDSERTDGQMVPSSKARPKAEDMKVLKNRLDELAARMNIYINYA